VLDVLRRGGYDGWLVAEWEKRWHPEIEEPEVALPHEAAVSRFMLVAAVGFGLTYIFMSLFVHAAGIPYVLAQMATTGIVMLWSFTAHRLWTFPADRNPNGLAAAAGPPSRPTCEGR